MWTVPSWSSHSAGRGGGYRKTYGALWNIGQPPPGQGLPFRPWTTVGYPLKPGCYEALPISYCIDDVIMSPVGWTEDPAGRSRGAKAGEGAGGVHSTSDRPSFSSRGGSR